MPSVRSAKDSQKSSVIPRDGAVPHPVACREGRGVRYFDCPHYDDCLDKAAKGLWAGFTCAHCLFYQRRDLG